MILIMLRAVLALLVFLVFFLLLGLIRKERLIQKTAGRLSDQLQAHSMERQKQLKRIQYQDRRTGILKLEGMLYSSGLQKAVPFMSAELLILFMLLLAGTGYAMASFLKTGLLFKVLALLLGPALILLVLHVKALLNYNRIEKNLIAFLNLLDNFSTTEGEITAILYKVSRFLEPPLSTILQECYFQTQITGDTSRALFELQEKASHPKFKEIIRNLEVCSRYDADYASVVSSNRKNIQDYMAYRKKRRSIINVAKTELFLLVLMAVFLLGLINVLLQTNVWEIAFRTAAGRAILGFMVLVLAGFYCSVVLFDRD